MNFYISITIDHPDFKDNAGWTAKDSFEALMKIKFLAKHYNISEKYFKMEDKNI